MADRCAQCGRELEPLTPEQFHQRVAEYERVYGKFHDEEYERVCDDCYGKPDLNPIAVEERVARAERNKLNGG